jgi:hypothetical protein
LQAGAIVVPARESARPELFPEAENSLPGRSGSIFPGRTDGMIRRYRLGKLWI